MKINFTTLKKADQTNMKNRQKLSARSKVLEGKFT